MYYKSTTVNTTGRDSGRVVERGCQRSIDVYLRPHGRACRARCRAGCNGGCHTGLPSNQACAKARSRACDVAGKIAQVAEMRGPGRPPLDVIVVVTAHLRCDPTSLPQPLGEGGRFSSWCLGVGVLEEGA